MIVRETLKQVDIDEDQSLQGNQYHNLNYEIKELSKTLFKKGLS